MTIEKLELLKCLKNLLVDRKTVLDKNPTNKKIQTRWKFLRSTGQGIFVMRVLLKKFQDRLIDREIMPISKQLRVIGIQRLIELQLLEMLIPRRETKFLLPHV